MNEIKIVSKKEDKFTVGRKMLDDGRIATIVQTKAIDGTEVTMILDQKDSNRLLRLIATASVTTTSDLNDMYGIFEKKYNPYPVQMSRESAFRHALQDELIDDETYCLARKYYGNLWNYVGD